MYSPSIEVRDLKREIWWPKTIKEKCGEANNPGNLTCKSVSMRQPTDFVV